VPAVPIDSSAYHGVGVAPRFASVHRYRLE
jgi:hypothetical protein